MDRRTVEATILNLAGEMLSGKATKDDIKKVTQLAKESNCLDILKREFQSVGQILNKSHPA